MGRLFLSLVRMSLSASVLVAVVLILRAVLRAAPKWIRCALWALVAVRLVCPALPESPLSLQPETGISQAEERYSLSEIPVAFPEAAASAWRAAGDGLNGGLGVQRIRTAERDTDGSSVTVTSQWWEVWVLFGQYVWLIGMAAMLLYAFLSWLRIRRRVREAALLRDNVWLSDRIDSPFILGAVRPRIFLPSDMETAALPQVLAHETAHLRRRDHWWKPLGFLLLSVYWFNPLLWLAYLLLCRDIELACDEKVVREFDAVGRKAYAEALLQCSAPRSMLTACPLAFGELGVRERIRAVVNYKRPAFWIVVAAIAAFAVAGICFLTNPSRFHPDFSREDLLGAEVFHALYMNDVGVWQMDSAGLDTLYDRLQGLTETRRSGFQGLTPLYTITLSLRYQGNLQLRGYAADGSNTELYYDGKTFRITDAAFRSYVREVCERDTLETASAEAPEPFDDSWLRPPALSLLGREPVTAYAGTYVWNAKKDGHAGQISANSVHPLAMEPGEELPVLNRPKYDTISSSKPEQVFLSFEREPDSVRIFRWSDDYWKSGLARAETVRVISPYLTLFGFDLSPGGYVYEVIADWQEAEAGYGMVCYYFYGYLSDYPDVSGEVHIPWVSADPLPYRGPSWISDEPEDYGVTEAMLRMRESPDFDSMTLEALGAYFLHSDGAGAEGAAFCLYRWFMDYPDSVIIYLDRIRGRRIDGLPEGENTAEKLIALAIAHSADDMQAYLRLVEAWRSVYPSGDYAWLLDLLETGNEIFNSRR